MGWKKILKAAFIPMTILFIIYLASEMYSFSLTRALHLSAIEFLILSRGVYLLMFIYTGYAAVRSNLKDSDLIVSGIIAVFLFSVVAQALIALIVYHCDISTDLNYCFSRYVITPGPVFCFLGVVGLTLGWSLALTIQKIRKKETPAKVTKQKKT